MWKGVKVRVSNLKVVSFKLPDKTNYTIRYQYTPLEITLILEDNTELSTDYIKISPHSYTTLKHIQLDETLELIEKIRTEHNKLVILGLGYPIYSISFLNPVIKGKNNVVCTLVDFNTTSGELNTYTLKRFVHDIELGYLKNIDVKELILTYPIDAYNFGSMKNTRVIGLEYIKNINDDNLCLINYNVLKSKDKTLILDHIESVTLISNKVTGIERIILNNTCSIIDIPLRLFKNIKTLKEIVICDSVETIHSSSFIECIRRDKDGLYFNVDSPSKFDYDSSSDRLVRVNFWSTPSYLEDTKEQEE